MMPINWQNERERRKAYINRLGPLESERSLFFNHWQDLSTYILPRRGRFFVEDRNNGSTSINADINDSTGTLALRTLAAGLQSGITSPARPWFRLTTPDPEMMNFAPVRSWLHKVEMLMRMVFARSNLYNCLHVVYEELGLFGTAVMHVDADFDTVCRGYTMTAGEYVLGLSERMDVNASYRKTSMTVWQCVERFGETNVSQTVRDAYKRGEWDRWVRVLHVIAPNVGYRPGALGPRGKAWTSAYIDLDAGDQEPKAFMREAGYNDKPFMAPRWTVKGADTYGHSPCMEALPDVKQLQHMQLRKAEAIDKQVDPPLNAPTQLANTSVDTLPGGVNYIDMTQPNGGVRPVYEVSPQLQYMQLDMQETRDRIREACYYDLFRMLATTLQGRREVTAREVEERHEEKLVMLGPVLERLHDELLNPLIDRVFAIMARANMLPEAPRELAGQPLRVEYISILAQAQKAVGINSIERLAGFVTGMAQFDPQVLMKVDMAKAVEEYADALGTPPDIVVSQDKYEERVRAAAEMQARQQALVEQQADAAAAKDLSQAQTSEPSVLSDFL